MMPLPQEHIEKVIASDVTPIWKAIAFYRGRDEEVFMAAGIFGVEAAVLACLQSSSHPWRQFIADEGHLYVPLSWAKEAYPRIKEQIQAAEDRVSQLGRRQASRRFVQTLCRPQADTEGGG